MPQNRYFGRLWHFAFTSMIEPVIKSPKVCGTWKTVRLVIKPEPVKVYMIVRMWKPIY